MKGVNCEGRIPDDHNLLDLPHNKVIIITDDIKMSSNSEHTLFFYILKTDLSNYSDHPFIFHLDLFCYFKCKKKKNNWVITNNYFEKLILNIKSEQRKLQPPNKWTTQTLNLKRKHLLEKWTCVISVNSFVLELLYRFILNKADNVLCI